MKKPRIGIAGAGDISGIYIRNLGDLFGGVADIGGISAGHPASAQRAADKYGLNAYESTDAMLADPDIDIILNLTPPTTHFSVAKAALAAGKHVYNEKPLSAGRDQAAELLALARERNLRIGCAPDTFMGAGLQTARKALDDGWIGRPLAATAFFASHGVEHWHPNPDFFYQEGAGPLFDMGPYYLTALVSLLGPAASVSGNATTNFATRTIAGGKRQGETIEVSTTTHYEAILNFANGVTATMIMSFDIWAHSLPCIEIYGSAGTMRIGDPNWFASPVEICRYRENEWHDLPLLLPEDRRYSEWEGEGANWRGIGLADMAMAIAEGRPHRASAEMAFHVLDLMCAVGESARDGTRHNLDSTCERPAPLHT
jgi:predicted dehydrogenase